MRISTLASFLVGAGFVAASPVTGNTETVLEREDGNTIIARDIRVVYKDCDIITPKVFIISMFSPEADIWYENANTTGSIGDLLAQNITVAGFSPLFPDAHCLADGTVCQLTTGESEINAATTITALLLSPLFDLTKTYFMIGGIAGVNPRHGTLAAVAFSKYAIQVALQYEFDAREIPSNYSTGYIPQGSYSPGEYPGSIYGTEVFEVSETLRDIAAEFASKATLNDTSDAIAYRANYVQAGITSNGTNVTNVFAAATQAPGILKCDVATSDVYFSGTLLGEAFENTTTLLTNGSGIYCMTAQEDNATLEAMVRAAVKGLVDFSRIIIMRTASDFDRPYPGISPEFNLLYSNQGGFEPAVENIYLAGNLVVKGILDGWAATFESGIEASNYIGDIFGTLGGSPDFGPGSIFLGETEPTIAKRDIKSRADMYKSTKGPLAARAQKRSIES